MVLSLEKKNTVQAIPLFVFEAITSTLLFVPVTNLDLLNNWTYWNQFVDKTADNFEFHY